MPLDGLQRIPLSSFGLAFREAFQRGQLPLDVLFILPLDHQLVQGHPQKRAGHRVGERK